jgi:transcription initiation factor TFIID TATA-box-binding protein
MDSLTSHPATAQQAKQFTSPASLSFPGGLNEEGQQMNAQGEKQSTEANGVTPATPATSSNNPLGIVPTLQ